MKVFIIIMIVVAIIIFYMGTNVAQNVSQDLENIERCAEFDISDEENTTLGYGGGIRKLLKGCF